MSPTTYHILSSSDIDNALRSQKDRRITRLDVGPCLSRAPHRLRTLYIDARQLFQLAEKFPNVDDGAIVAHDVHWLPVQLPLPALVASPSSGPGWLAVFHDAETASALSNVPHDRTTRMIVPIGLVTRSTITPTRTVRRGIQVVELDRSAQAAPQALAAEAQELAFYGGTWEQLSVFGEVMESVGGQIQHVGLCWRNLSNLASHDVPRACAFLKLDRCSVLRSLDVWLPLHLSGQDPAYWRMAAEILVAAKYSPVNHIQLVLDAMVSDTASAYEELKQGRWDVMKHALLHLTDLKTISIASTIADEPVVEGFFGLVMDRLEELQKKGIRIVQSKGPLFTVAGYTAATC